MFKNMHSMRTYIDVSRIRWFVYITLISCIQITCSNGDSSPGNALILRADDTEHLSGNFRSTQRDLYFHGLRVSIQQNWRDVGVAAVVWDAAVVLCEYMVEHPELVTGKAVVEIGAGTGLAGLVAAKLGGIVTLTDREIAMDILQRNLDLNRRLCTDTQSSCYWLDWVFHTKSNLPRSSPCEGLYATNVKVLNWGENLKEHPTYDVIVAADVVYLEDTFTSLIQTFQHLSSQNTMILLSCKIRYARDRRFLNLMRTDFVLEQVVSVPDKRIYLYKARLK